MAAAIKTNTANTPLVRIVPIINVEKTALKRLQHAGELELVRQGRGRTPSRYKVKAATPATQEGNGKGAAP